MSTRDDVYAAISAEMDYLETEYKESVAQHGEEFIPIFNWRAEDFLVYIFAVQDRIAGCLTEKARLDAMREIAAWAMMALQHCGGCARNVNTGEPMEFLEPILKMSKVQAIVNTERQYQDELRIGRTDGGHKSSGYIVMLRHYVTQATERWTTHPGDEYALDVLRKVAGIAVHCLEDCGVTFREVV